MIPDIPGLDDLRGHRVPLRAWDHDYDLTGRHVAVIGTGASAVQFVPRIQPLVGRLTVFQRTPAWIMPRHDRQISRLERWLFRHVPATSRPPARASTAGGRLTRSVSSRIRPSCAPRRPWPCATCTARSPIRRCGPGSPRPTGWAASGSCSANDYYPALAARRTSRWSPTGIAEMRGSTWSAADGTEHQVDTLIFGTGFHVTDFPFARRGLRRRRRPLASRWSARPARRFAARPAGLPEPVRAAGPNTGLGTPRRSS